jgi:hypothetical protein
MYEQFPSTTLKNEHIWSLKREIVFAPQSPQSCIGP